MKSGVCGRGQQTPNSGVLSGPTRDLRRVLNLGYCSVVGKFLTTIVGADQGDRYCIFTARVVHVCLRPETCQSIIPVTSSVESVWHMATRQSPIQCFCLFAAPVVVRLGIIDVLKRIVLLNQRT